MALDDIPYQDYVETKNNIQLAAVHALEQSLSKFTDVLYSKYLKKQDKKLRKKKNKEQQHQQLQQDSEITPLNQKWMDSSTSNLNVDSYLAGSNKNQLASGGAYFGQNQTNALQRNLSTVQ